MSIAKKIGLFSLGLCCVSGFAEEQTPRPEHVSASHTEGKGLGYSKGYSSLDLFLSQPFSSRTMVFFTDLRGHVFNDGKYAANAGMGFRVLTRSKQVCGINATYDYLQTSRRIYNQVGGGLEVMGENWDARVNAYIPVGGKTKNSYRFAPGFRLKAREQFAMKGFDTLFSYRFCNGSFLDLHVGAGPYYYCGSSAKTKDVFPSAHRQTWGIRAAAGISFWDYLIVEGVGSYDGIFNWSGQGTVTLSIPFDFTLKMKDTRKNKPSYCLQKRLYEPLWRNEIVTVDSLNRSSFRPGP